VSAIPAACPWSKKTMETVYDVIAGADAAVAVLEDA
jgi:hypothetical protein